MAGIRICHPSVFRSIGSLRARVAPMRSSAPAFSTSSREACIQRKGLPGLEVRRDGIWMERWKGCSERGVRVLSTTVARRKEKGDVERIDDVNNKQPPKPSLTRTLTSKLPHENIYTLPNILTFSRLLATPVIGYLIVTHQPTPAFFLFAYAGISDLVDGWIARKWKQQTVVGSVVDPMADKVLMTTLVGCLGWSGGVPLPLATLILGRDISLATAALYYRYASLPSPKTMARYWDFSLPSAEVHPTAISKLNTFLQLVLIGATMVVGLMSDSSSSTSTSTTTTESTESKGVLASLESWLGGRTNIAQGMTLFQGLVAGTTLWSGLSYVWNRDAVKILGPDEALKKKQGYRGRMIVGGSYGLFIAGAAWLGWRDWVRKGEERKRVAREG